MHFGLDPVPAPDGVSGYRADMGLRVNRFPRAGPTMYSLPHASANVRCALGVVGIGRLAEHWALPTTMAVLAHGPVIAAGLVAPVLRERPAERDTTELWNTQ